MSEKLVGWHACASLDAEPSAAPAPATEEAAPGRLGEVHVLVHKLNRGHSEVRVGGSGAGEVELIGSAIVELQDARRIFIDLSETSEALPE